MKSPTTRYSWRKSEGKRDRRLACTRTRRKGNWEHLLSIATCQADSRALAPFNGEADFACSSVGLETLDSSPHPNRFSFVSWAAVVTESD